jgi:hypothetical protein
MDKSAWRKKMAALTFSEKIRILEKLRQRSSAIAASGLRRAPGTPPQPSSKAHISDKS